MSEPSSSSPSFWTPRTQVAAGILALIVVSALVLTGLNLMNRKPIEPPPSPANSSPTASAEGCPAFTVGPDAARIDAAPAASWVLVGRMAAPTVADAGPAVTDEDGWRHCYAQSAVGALVAAANLVAMTTVPELVERLAEDGIMPGDLRDRAMSTPATPTAPAPLMQIRGFRLVSYSAELSPAEWCTTR